MDTQNQPLPLFPIQVLQITWLQSAELNPALITDVLRLRQELRSVTKSNLGGWHSPSVLQQRNEPALSQFVRQLPTHLNAWAELFFALPNALDPARWEMEVWANCNETGHANKAHDHFRSGVVASGFYYVRCGGPDVGGETVFINQQSCPLNIQSPVPLRQAEFSVSPRDGDMYIFPSWLGHRVNPYLGHETRISLAFNAWHPALEVRKKTDSRLFSGLRRSLKKRR